LIVYLYKTTLSSEHKETVGLVCWCLKAL